MVLLEDAEAISSVAFGRRIGDSGSICLDVSSQRGTRVFRGICWLRGTEILREPWEEDELGLWLTKLDILVVV